MNARRDLLAALRRLPCRFGWHRWSWRYFGDLGMDCSRCGRPNE